MPRVKTCKCSYEGVEFQEEVRVDGSGMFTIRRPGTPEDWQGHDMLITGAVLKQVELEWAQAVRDLNDRRATRRRVLVVFFDSTLREGGAQSSSSDRDCMCTLRAAVAEEVSVLQGGHKRRTFQEAEEYRGLHSSLQPFPVLMTLALRDIPHRPVVVLPWSQETQDIIAKACQGLEAVIRMLDSVLTSPEAFEKARNSLVSMVQPLLHASTTTPPPSVPAADPS